MTKEIHSIKFYEIMAQAIADKDDNGKIDTPEEQSIFDKYMKQFDMNKDDKFRKSDVKAYKKSVFFSKEEQDQMRKLQEFKETH